jgi:hypothetical protein
MSGTSGSKVYYSKTSMSTMQSSPAIPAIPANSSIIAQNYPSIAKDGNTVGMVWVQRENGEPQVALLLATDITKGFANWTPVVTNTSGNIANADIAIRNGMVHVVWEDKSTGTVMYRKGSISGAASINNPAEAENVALWPLPADKALSIRFKKPPTSCSITINDLAGRMVFQQAYSAVGNSLEIPTAQLPAGSYLLLLSTTTASTIKNISIRH